MKAAGCVSGWQTTGGRSAGVHQQGVYDRRDVRRGPQHPDPHQTQVQPHVTMKATSVNTDKLTVLARSSVSTKWWEDPKTYNAAFIRSSNDLLNTLHESTQMSHIGTEELMRNFSSWETWSHMIQNTWWSHNRWEANDHIQIGEFIKSKVVKKVTRNYWFCICLRN